MVSVVPPGFMREGLSWASGFALALACVAGIGGGLSAVLAVAAGALVAGASAVMLVHGLGSILSVASMRSPTEAGSRGLVPASIGFVLRHGLVGFALWALLAAGLPAGWLLASVTAWPLALGLAALRRATGASLATAARS